MAETSAQGGQEREPGAQESTGLLATNRRKVGAALGGALLLGGAVAGVMALDDDGSAERHREMAESTAEFDECEDLAFENVAANPDLYARDAFLPRAEQGLNNAEDVQKYINNLFDGNGPLGTKIDKVSASAFNAVIVFPSHDGEATNPNFNYLEAFQDSLAAYNAPEGAKEAAEKFCNLSYETALQTAQYNPNWAQEGETVLQFTAGRNDTYEITEARFEELVTTETLSGVVFDLRESSRGIDGFVEVLVDDEGRIFLKGVAQGPAGVKIETGEEVEPVTPEEGEGEITTGTTIIPQRGPQGQQEGQEGGPSHGQPGEEGVSQPGPGPDEGGPGVQETTTTTQPAPSTTTTTQPSTTTTTSPPPPPPTTQPEKGPEPEECPFPDNPEYCQ